MPEFLAKLIKDEDVPFFYDLRNQTVALELTEMYFQRDAIDLITLQQRLKDKQRLEEVGGIAYLVKSVF